jgi:FemAB-related protein (PEP-CTERM system-associated)
MFVAELQERDRIAWDTYVEQAAGGLPQHLSGWADILSQTYGYPIHYLMAREGKRVEGVLPLFVVRSPLMGNSIRSMPGGLCADGPEAATALIERAREIARQIKVRRLVLQDTRQVWPGDMHTTSAHVHWVVDVRGGVDEAWKQLNKETRRQVRIARKNGLTAEIDRTGNRLAEFHYVLSRFVHQAGAPAFGRDFLERIVETFPGRFNIAVTYEDKQPVGAYFQLTLANTVYGIWGATLREHLRAGAAYLAYWEILADTANHGYHFWDMGRSPAGSNTSKFKAKWISTSSPVYQQVLGVNSDRPGDSIVNRVQTDAKFRLFMWAWSRLPFPVARFLGPKLRRHVPFA